MSRVTLVVYMDMNGETSVIESYSSETNPFSEKPIQNLEMQAGLTCSGTTVQCGTLAVTKPSIALTKEVLATGKEVTTKCTK